MAIEDGVGMKGKSEGRVGRGNQKVFVDYHEYDSEQGVLVMVRIEFTCNCV